MKNQTPTQAETQKQAQMRESLHTQGGKYWLKHMINSEINH